MKRLISAITIIIIAFSSFSVSADALNVQRAKIVETIYPTADTVIADICADESPYNADKTGINDSTKAIQNAIDDCAGQGGGTVFLPAGKYRITSSIFIRQFVTLRGDWADPDIYSEQGTLIIADVESQDSMNPALIYVGASAGALGLSVWYPDQKIDNVKPYPFTFYVEGNDDAMLHTVMNCTLINSYRGIGVCSECENGIKQVHEMFTADTIKGTCLYQGLNATNSSDVDTYKTVYFLNKYWAESGSKYNAPDIDKLNDYTKEHAYGMILGDLEWPEFCDIKISSCLYGINIIEGTRYTFSGTFADLYITECKYGFFVNENAIFERGKQWGTSVFNGIIEGSKYAVYDIEKNSLTLTNVKTIGKVKAKNMRRYSFSGYGSPDYSHTYARQKNNLYIVNADKSGKTDSSKTVQNTLDNASLTGGIVYLPAGLYRFDNPVNVPANVELRGSSSVANRDQSGNSSGTLIISYYGYNSGDSPLITLGSNSGLSGLRIDFLLNNPVDDSGKYKQTSPAVYSHSNNVYITNCFITLASVGIKLEGSKNAYIKKLVGCCYENMFNLSQCSNVYIEGCLQNGNALPRNGYSKFDIPEMQNRINETNIFEYVFIPITRVKTVFFNIKNSQNITIFNVFIYGGKSYINSENSSVVIFNAGNDGSSKEDYALNISGGDLTAVNFMRSTSDGQKCTKLYKSEDKASLKIINTQAVNLGYHENPILKNIHVKSIAVQDLKYYLMQPLYSLVMFIGKLFT